MAEDILGISGQMDISDIQQSFDKLIGNLNQLGVKTDEVSRKMSKALNDIAQSAASDSEKTKQSIEAYKNGIAEINKALETTPEALKRLGAEATTAEATLDKLKNKLSEAQEGSQKWNEINEQLKNQQNLVSKLNGEYDAMLGSFGNAQQYVGTLMASIDAVNAGRSVSTAVTGASAVAHTGVTAAVGAEALAHGENSIKIAEETKVTQENTEAKLKLTKTEEEYSYNAQMEAEQIQKVAQRLAEGRSDEEEYINTKKSGMAVREAIVEKMEAEKQKIKELSDLYANSKDANGGTATPEVHQQYNDGVKEATENLTEYRSELTSINTALDSLETGHFKAKTAINEQADATENLKNKTDEAKEASDVYFMGEKATIESVTKAMQEMEAELKSLKDEEKSLKGSGGDNTEKLKENEEGQKRLNQYISEGHEALRQLGTNYKEAQKAAKEVAKETKNIGDKADDAAKKVGGIFSKFKGAIGGALKGDFSGIFSFFGKIGVWGAALGAIGKGLYELTVRAEEFRAALQPLSHYIDDNRLDDVRQDILALSSTTTKSVADMAQAATQFVKVWEGLRDSSDALITMVKSANEFGALAGKTSQESAKYLSNLASEYHMTAQEATEASAMIATAAHNSTSTFGEMADAISSAGTNASMYGVSFKDMTTLIGYSSNQFGGAQKAASKFSMLLMSMEKMQNEKYKPSVVGMVQALQNLKDAMDKGELSEKSFQGRIRQTARYFINNADAIAEYGKHIDSTKAKEELLADANARASVNVNKLKNAWEGFLTSVNANLTPILTNVLQFFNKIIGGAQRTADELNYLKNFDKIHKDSKQGQRYAGSVTSNWTGDPLDNAVINMGAKSQYNANKDQGLELYRKQRDRLKRIYQQGLKNAQNAWKHASGNAYANSAGNFMLNYYNKNRASFSEFTPQMFNELLRSQRASTIALTQKTINTSNGGGSNFTPTPDKDKEKLAEQQRQYREQQAEQQAKQLADDKKIEWELYVAEQEKGIAEMHEGNEKELAQRKLDFEKKKHQIDEEAESLRQKNISVAKAAYDKNPANKKKEGFYASGLDKNITLTDEQMKLIQAKKEILNAEINAESRKREKESIDALNAYLKEYGTYQEKRLAIAEEYTEKIKDAQTQGEKNTLQAQLNKALSDLDFNEFKNKINWEDIFGNLGNLTIKQLKTIKEQLRSLLKEGNIDADKYKTTVEQIDKINEAIVTSQDKVKSAFGLLLPMAEQRKILEANIAEAQERQDEAIRQQAAAQADLNNSKIKVQRALQNAKVYDVLDSSIRTDRSQMILSKVAEKNGVDSKEYKDVSDAMTEVAESENKVNDANEKVITSTNNLANAQSKLKIFSEDFANKLKSLSEVVGVVASNLQSLPDLFGQLGISSDSAFGKAASDFANAGSSAMNSLSALQNGNFVGALSGGIGTIKSTVSGFTNLLGLGGNGKEVAKTTENLQKANERLTYSINALKDSIDKQSGARAVSNYEKAYEAQKQANQNAMKILETQMGYHGSHHSNSYYWNLSDNDYAKINSVLKSQADVRGGYSEATINSVHSLEDIYKLTPEQMKDIRVYASDVWKTMTDQGKYDKSEFWENVTEQAEKLDELTQKINENLTQMSFDSMKSNFLNDLMDMSKDAKDVANDMSNDFAESLQKAMLNYSLSDTYDKTLKPLYEKWATAMKNHTLSKTEIEAFKKEYDDAVQEGLRQREQISLITGYTGSQSGQTATGKGIEAITEDQGSSLIGIGYAMQIALEQGNEVRKGISLDVSYLRSFSETIGNNISEMRDIQYQGLEQLQAINKNTAPIILIREDIASMYKLMKDRY